MSHANPPLGQFGPAESSSVAGAESEEESRAFARLPTFEQTLEAAGAAPLKATGVDVLQVNVGKLCNQTCVHCHVDAGPKRRESMSLEVAEACLRLLDLANISTLDLTGGAPEMNPHFRRLVEGARRLGRRVVDRCNLTILVEPGYEDLPEFLAANGVEVTASLPCYLAENVDRQRGPNAFSRSIRALRRLNAAGYGLEESKLPLTLVYNPTGDFLPPDQDRLEAHYRVELRSRYGIEFSRLIAIVNMPISRHLNDLRRRGRYVEYMERLVRAFNPATTTGLMCRSTLSVDWRGELYDCDFNQMAALPIASGGANVLDLCEADVARLATRRIATDRHCFGCTAGVGSSCQGRLT